MGVGPQKVLSAPDAIAQALERYMSEKQGVQAELPIEAPVTTAPGGGGPATLEGHSRFVDHTATTLGACPECGAGQLAFEEGCKRCYVCGFSECG